MWYILGCLVFSLAIISYSVITAKEYEENSDGTFHPVKEKENNSHE
ncbi:MAG: hypothetical protein ACOC1K_07290 [Nanoarchaeota archaeon]